MSKDAEMFLFFSKLLTWKQLSVRLSTTEIREPGGDKDSEGELFLAKNHADMSTRLAAWMAL